jgi:hypothetical protein
VNTSQYVGTNNIFNCCIRRTTINATTSNSSYSLTRDFLVSITACETTITVEGDGFEGVGIVDNLMCCAVKLVAVKRNEISKILEENDI